MSLRDLFILNLKKIRKSEGLSQMKLAEKCNTAASYIGEIEIGRKFPSVEMIEKIAGALKVEPYLLFKEERPKPSISTEARTLYARLSLKDRDAFNGLLMLAMGRGLEAAVTPEQPEAPPDEQPGSAE
ncbi:hypothetical protein AGMMS49587_02700 [Spirochaetia bacterium]|nr:hypothetical protein AGMMS49587_02700 [Spirochaetia bacterium]